MPRGIPRHQCRLCDRHTDECGPLSARGLCFDCGTRRALANADELRAHSGPFFQHWRTRTLAAFGVGELDAGRRES